MANYRRFAQLMAAAAGAAAAATATACSPGAATGQAPVAAVSRVASAPAPRPTSAQAAPSTSAAVAPAPSPAASPPPSAPPSPAPSGACGFFSNQDLATFGLERHSFPVHGLLASSCGFVTQGATDPLAGVAVIDYSTSADQVVALQAGSGPAFAFVPGRGFYQRGYTDKDGAKCDILFATSNSTAVSASIIATSYANITGAQSACQVTPGLAALIESKIPSGR